jgi:hypothetical protein
MQRCIDVVDLPLEHRRWPLWWFGGVLRSGAASVPVLLAHIARRRDRHGLADFGGSERSVIGVPLHGCVRAWP